MVKAVKGKSSAKDAIKKSKVKDKASVKKGKTNGKLDAEAADRASRYRTDRDPMQPRTQAKSHLAKGIETTGALDFGTSSKASKLKAWKAADFKGADYNPRYITEGRLKKLTKSMHSFGDLSGVVFNARSNKLVSGHQRMKTVKDCKTEIITKKHIDKHGTIEIGHIRASTPNGVIDIPLRIVDWSESKVEKAANIAANSHGGEFDKDKLQKVLRDLDPRLFDIELLGLDPLTITSLAMPAIPIGKISKDGGESDGRQRESDEEDEGGEFTEFDENSFSLKCQCPRCGYKFDPKNVNTSAKKKDSSEEAPKKSKKSKIEKKSIKASKKSAPDKKASKKADKKAVGGKKKRG